MLRRISARYFRGFGAAVVAVAALVLAANAGPARRRRSHRPAPPAPHGPRASPSIDRPPTGTPPSRRRPLRWPRDLTCRTHRTGPHRRPPGSRPRGLLPRPAPAPGAVDAGTPDGRRARRPAAHVRVRHGHRRRRHRRRRRPAQRARADRAAARRRGRRCGRTRTAVRLPDARRDVCTPAGHDLHVTWLAGAARALAAGRDAWSGTLLVLGQPAEETGEGASAMVADGLQRFPRPTSCSPSTRPPVPPGSTPTRPA